MKRRVTPEEVVAAYRKINASPIRLSWADYGNTGVQCVCGMGAMLMAEIGTPFEDIMFLVEREDYERLEDLAMGLGLEEEYTSGFISGFDDAALTDFDQSERWRLGYEDGSSAAKLIFGGST